MAQKSEQAPRNVFLNPERAPALLSKWQKLLGKDLKRIEVVYTADGVSVDLYGLGEFAKENEDGDDVSISVAEYKAKKAEVLAPSAEDAKFQFRVKYEVRLNKEFPEKTVNLKDGSEAALREATMSLPFNERRVMLMSNKQFKTAYPNGFAAAQAAAN